MSGFDKIRRVLKRYEPLMVAVIAILVIVRFVP